MSGTAMPPGDSFLCRKWQCLRKAAPVITLLGVMLGLTVLAVLVLVMQITPPPGPAPAGGLPRGFTDGGNYTLALLGTLLAVLGLIFSTAGAALWLWLRGQIDAGFQDHQQTLTKVTDQYRKHLDSLVGKQEQRLAAIARKEVRRQVRRSVSQPARRISHLASAHALVETALAHWQIHEYATRAASTPGVAPAQASARAAAAADALDLAIATGEKAFELVYPRHNADTHSISNLKPDTYELRFKARLVTNQCFYLVTRDRAADRALAADRVGLAGALADRCRREDEAGWRDLVDSWLWVAWKTGVMERGEVVAGLRALRQSPGTPQPWEARYQAAGLVIAW